MEIPKVIEELILSYVWAIEHPVCKLLRDERQGLRNIHETLAFHDDSFFPYLTYYQGGRVSRHFIFRSLKIHTSESFYCHRCGESYTELPFCPDTIDRCECWVYDWPTVPNAANNP